jgi:hypothetical protein
MIGKIQRFAIILVVISGMFSNVKAQEIQPQAKLSQTAIPLGDQTQLHLSIRFPTGTAITWPLLKDSIAGKLLIVEAGKPDTTVDQADKNLQTIRQSFTITSFDPGTYQIPAYEFKTNNGTFKSTPLALTITSVAVDTTKGIYDIKQPIAVSYTFLDWLKDNWHWVALGFAILAAIIVLIFYLLKKKPKAKAPIMETRKFVPAHQVALSKLSALRDKKLWQSGLIKEYYIELSDILRQYLEGRYDIKTHEKTTEEIFVALKYKIMEPTHRQLLKQMLSLADLVKFAKEKPLATENEQAMDTAITFVEETKMVLQSNESKIGKDGLV